MDISIFIFIFTYSHQLGVLLFESQSVFLCYYSEIKRILLLKFDNVFYLFPQYSYTYGIKLVVRIFCYMSLVLTGHVFKNLHVFRSFKVLCVLSFTIINEPSLQEYGINTSKDKFLFIFINSSIAANYPSYP